jgi:hypothetical protein
VDGRFQPQWSTLDVWTDPATPTPEAGNNMLFDIPMDESADPGRFRQMLDAIRGRDDRSQARR